MATVIPSRLDPSQVHLFSAGLYDQGTSGRQLWTVDDLRSIVRNHYQLCRGERPLYRPVVVIGHVQPKADGSHTAIPAYAVVDRLWVKGGDLYGSFAEPAPELLEWVRGGYLRGLSVELYRGPGEANIPPDVAAARGVAGPMLRRVAMLGGHPPRAKGLWVAGERAQADSTSRYATQPGFCCGEETRMDRDHLMQVAQQAGHGQQFLDTLSDDQLSGLVADMAGRMLSGGTAAGGPGNADTSADTTNPDDTTGADMTAPSRDQMVADLVAAGQDQQTVEQMDDASLKELWQQLQGGGGAAGGGGGTSAAPSTYGERGSARGKQVARPQVIQLSPHALREYVRAEARSAAAKASAPDRNRKVVEFCEQMVRDGFLSPAQVERDAKGQPLGPVLRRLLRASPICFAEGMPSELEQQMEEIRSGGQVRTYGERLAGTEGGAVGGNTGGADAAFEARLKKHYDARLARFSKG